MPAESGVQPIELVGELTGGDAELSSLAWHGNRLVLLPQFPSRFAGPNGGSVFAIGRSQLSIALNGGTPVEPTRIPFSAPEIEALIPGFEGFESIAFHGSDVFVTAEAHTEKEGTTGYLLKGVVERDLASIRIDTTRRIPLARQASVDNLSYEALTVVDGRVTVVYEANGPVNSEPRAEVFDLELNRLPSATMDRLAFRVTDLTNPDPEGRVWTTNYFYEGDSWADWECPLKARFGVGVSHTRAQHTERLVELRISAREVMLTERAPIQLELRHDGQARNWEGIARLGNRGFVLVTDQYPSTLLAFVPAP